MGDAEDDGNDDDDCLSKSASIYSSHYHELIGMEDTIASTLSDALTWVATTTATAVEEWPTDQGDVPVIGPPAGDMTGPDDSEGSYFLVSWWTIQRNCRCD